MHFLNVAVLLAYLRWVLGLDFQGRLPEMLLVILTGCVMGVSLGILVLSIGKWQEKIKIGIMLGITMTAGFLAGLMFAQMKYIVDQYAPVINRFNPAALIADAFYCINVYDDPSRYARDLITLSVMSAAMLAVSVLVLYVYLLVFRGYIKVIKSNRLMICFYLAIFCCVQYLIPDYGKKCGYRNVSDAGSQDRRYQ